jgi:hypothetical protein
MAEEWIADPFRKEFKPAPGTEKTRDKRFER